MKVIVTTPSFGKFHTDIDDIMSRMGISLIHLIPFDRETALKEIKDAEAIIVGLETIDKEIINQGKFLKLIAKHGVGVDNIDLDTARKQGVFVTNVPGTNNDAVADLAFGLMLSSARSIVEANLKVKNGEWPRMDGHSVWGKTLGIIGLGSIGKGVAKRASGFSMNILGYDVNDRSPEEEKLDISRVTLEELLTHSDFISLHVPLNKHTSKMIGRDHFKIMKKTAILINTARGGLIDEEALYDALSKKLILGSGLDVFEEEPLKNEQLLALDNLIATPHMAAYTVEAGYLTSEKVIENLKILIEGKELNNIMNNPIKKHLK